MVHQPQECATEAQEGAQQGEPSSGVDETEEAVYEVVLRQAALVEDL